MTLAIATTEGACILNFFFENQLFLTNTLSQKGPERRNEQLLFIIVMPGTDYNKIIRLFTLKSPSPSILSNSKKTGLPSTYMKTLIAGGDER